MTAVDFSKEFPQLLAVGFFNGMIQVLDISDSDTNSIVARSQRNASAGFEPIWDMKWVFGKLLNFVLTAVANYSKLISWYRRGTFDRN